MSSRSIVGEWEAGESRGLYDIQARRISHPLACRFVFLFLSSYWGVFTPADTLQRCQVYYAGCYWNRFVTFYISASLLWLMFLSLGFLFSGCEHFRKCNGFLKALGKEEISFSIDFWRDRQSTSVFLHRTRKTTREIRLREGRSEKIDRLSSWQTHISCRDFYIIQRLCEDTQGIDPILVSFSLSRRTFCTSQCKAVVVW